MPSALRESMGSMGGEMGSISSATAVDRNGPLPWPRLQGDGAVSISPIHIRIKGNRRLPCPTGQDGLGSHGHQTQRTAVRTHWTGPHRQGIERRNVARLMPNEDPG